MTCVWCPFYFNINPPKIFLFQHIVTSNYIIDVLPSLTWYSQSVSTQIWNKPTQTLIPQDQYCYISHTLSPLTAGTENNLMQPTENPHLLTLPLNPAERDTIKKIFQELAAAYKVTEAASSPPPPPTHTHTHTHIAGRPTPGLGESPLTPASGRLYL